MNFQACTEDISWSIVVRICLCVQASVNVIPAGSVVSVERRTVPWWVIFLAILAAVIILAVIGGILWGVS